jgi:hypothetical protein
MTSTADPEFKKLQIILATLRFCIVILVLVFILYAKAQHFDETELIAIVTVAFAAAAGESLTGWFTRGKE